MPEIFKQPAVITGIITAISTFTGVIITLFVTQISLFLQRKYQVEERFFYEIFPKRLAIYEDVIKELSSMLTPDKSTVMMPLMLNPSALFANISDIDMLHRYEEYIHRLTVLISRISIYGSSSAETILRRLLLRMRHHPFDMEHIEDISMRPELWETFHSLVANTLIEFTEFIKEEVVTTLVDKKLSHFIRKVGGKPKKHKDIKHKKNSTNSNMSNQ